MQTEEKTWGEVIDVGLDEDEEDEDEIRKLIKQVKELKDEFKNSKANMSSDTINEISRKRNDTINKIEKEIYDLMHLKKQAKMFRS